MFEAIFRLLSSDFELGRYAGVQFGSSEQIVQSSFAFPTQTHKRGYGVVNTDDVRSGVGTHPVIWSFVDPGTNRPATVESVSFYIAGLSHTAEVTIYDQTQVCAQNFLY